MIMGTMQIISQPQASTPINIQTGNDVSIILSTSSNGATILTDETTPSATKWGITDTGYTDTENTDEHHI
jgi:hypothetical protein